MQLVSEFALPNKRFDPTAQARMLTPKAFDRGSSATRWADGGAECG